ncbi:lytic transglycosylase domain-containing protein [Gudongella sp. DL1XJH-153]|uniref:lytic transglycosylase domain-containing protein n=1 Tax=Gudongella sp. DL1XJH-153 TaxID=3409804 RepID=UPI003BB4BF88
MKKIFSVILMTALILILTISAVAMAYPFVYKDSVMQYSEDYNLDPMLVMGVIKAESNFDKDARSSKDARGLMQIGESTGKWAAEVFGFENYSGDMLYDPDFNIKVGTWYIRQLLDQYGSEEVALAAYNAGSGNVSHWLLSNDHSNDGVTLHTIPFPETREYVSRVEKNKKAYEFVYGNTFYSSNDTMFDKILLDIRKSITNIIKGLR